MFQRIKNKLLLGGAIGLAKTAQNHLKFKTYIGHYNTTLCASSESDLDKAYFDFLFYSTLGIIATQVASPICWEIYKGFHNFLYGEYAVDTYINDDGNYINPDLVENDLEEDDFAEGDPVLLLQHEEKVPDEKVLENHLQKRLDETKFDGQLPNGAMDVSTRDILNNPRALVPCGHSHSADQIQHFEGKCPCCRGIFSQSVPNHNLRQLLPEVVSMLETTVEKIQEPRLSQNPVSFYQIKNQMTEPERAPSFGATL